MTQRKRINRDDEYLLAFGAHLRQLRKTRKLTQVALAAEAGLWLSIVGRIERGEIDPTVSTLRKIAQGLDMEMSELFSFSQDKKA